MKTQYYTATSIDGYIADKDHSLDWLFQFGEVEGMEEMYPQFIQQVGAAAMGSATYEWVVDHKDMLTNPSRWPYDVPTWVFSRRELPVVEGADIRFVEGDAGPVHEEMVDVADCSNIWLVGGGNLVGQFHDRGLLDEIILSVAPVMLGKGAPVLPRKIADPPLKLTGVQRYGDVFAVLTYEVQTASE